MTLLRLSSLPTTPPPSARLFLALLRRIRWGHLVLVTPDGAQRIYGDPHAPPSATLRLNDWRACRAILRAGDIGFAQAYRDAWLDTPDPVALLRLAIRNEAALSRTVWGGPVARLWYALRHRLRLNTHAGSRRNIHAHYDLGNEFYALWLDPGWTYSSALFDGPTAPSLEAAQAAKYQRIIDTLGLRAGMRVLEIGCGWGGFVLHAARLGIEVRGVTISPRQHEIAAARLRAADVATPASVELRDYRDLDGHYDAIVSIEMFEAVGEAYWPTYFEVLKQRLAPGARALVQSITIADARFAAYRASSDFIRETIFPGGMLPSPARFIRAAADAGLHAVSTLSFGPDYARTLHCWRDAFESRLDDVRALGFDEAFVRTWRMYLAYCEAGFIEGCTDVRHFVVSRTP